MKSPWEALYALWSADAALVAMLGSDEAGDPSIWPEMRDQVEELGAFPMISTPGLTSMARLTPGTGDVEVSTWLTVLTTDDDPDGVRDAVELRLVELAEGTQASAWTFEGVRVGVRLLGARDANQDGRLRRRHIWAVGVN